MLSIDGEVPRQLLASYPGLNPETPGGKLRKNIKSYIKGSTAGIIKKKKKEVWRLCWAWLSHILKIRNILYLLTVGQERMMPASASGYLNADGSWWNAKWWTIVGSLSYNWRPMNHSWSKKIIRKTVKPNFIIKTGGKQLHTESIRHRGSADGRKLMTYSGDVTEETK